VTSADDGRDRESAAALKLAGARRAAIVVLGGTSTRPIPAPARSSPG
jgi:hypothetical protein